MKFLYVDDSCLEIGSSQGDYSDIVKERQERTRKGNTTEAEMKK